MIKIHRDDLSQIRDEYFNYLTQWLVDKRSKKKTKLDLWIEKAHDSGDLKYFEMLEFLRDNLKEIILINSLNTLRIYNAKFYFKFRKEIKLWKDADRNSKPNTSFGKFQKKMINSYTRFMESDTNIGYWFSRRLNITTCPYCNRHYTFTISASNHHPIIRPQFDHFMPKSLYPLTALTPFNIVPACPECNKIKGNKRIHIHPYEDSFDNHNLNFIIDSEQDSKLVIKNGEKHTNVNVLGLSEIYEQHHDLAQDIINRAFAYNSNYYNSLINNYSGLGLTYQEMERMIWGTCIDQISMLSRPFSKLTRDLLIQVGIIKEGFY